MYRRLSGLQVVFDVFAGNRAVAAVVVGFLLRNLPDNRLDDFVGKFECLAFHAIGAVVA